MKTKAIFAAAKTYQTNRDKGKGWDKETDCELVFGAMKDQGITGMYAMAGTFLGKKPNKKLFVVEIGDSKISMNTFEDEKDYWNSLRK